MRLLPRHSGLRPQFYILTLTAGPCTLSGVLHGAFRSCTYHAREEVDGNIVFTKYKQILIRGIPYQPLTTTGEILGQLFRTTINFNSDT